MIVYTLSLNFDDESIRSSNTQAQYLSAWTQPIHLGLAIVLQF